MENLGYITTFKSFGLSRMIKSAAFLGAIHTYVGPMAVTIPTVLHISTRGRYHL